MVFTWPGNAFDTHEETSERARRRTGPTNSRSHLYSTAYNTTCRWHGALVTVTSSGTTFLTLARAVARPAAALHGSTHARYLIPLLSLFLPPPPRPVAATASSSAAILLALSLSPSSFSGNETRRRRIRTRLFEGAGVRETRHRYALRARIRGEIFVAVFSTIPCDSVGERRERGAYMRVCIYTNCLDEVVSIIVYFIVGHVNTV